MDGKQSTSVPRMAANSHACISSPRKGRCRTPPHLLCERATVLVKNRRHLSPRSKTFVRSCGTYAAMIPSPADAWLQGSAMDQGSAGKGPGSALLPPRSKPRQSSSPASSVDRDGAPSIGRSGVKGGRTPRQASLHGAGSSGGKFSFGKCMLSRGKTSPLSFMRVGSQHAPSGAATPNLILGGTKMANNQQQQQPLLEPTAGFQQQAESDAKDISQARDCDKARPAVQDLDLQNRASGAAIDHAIQALTSELRMDCASGIPVHKHCVMPCCLLDRISRILTQEISKG